jgi:hypothetical protein
MLMRTPIGWPRSDPRRIGTKKEIADCESPAVSKPALNQMVLPIV